MTKKTTAPTTPHIAETRMPEKNISGVIVCTLLEKSFKVEVKIQNRMLTSFYQDNKIPFTKLFHDSIITIKRKFILSQDNEKNKEILTDEINKCAREIICVSRSNNFKKWLSMHQKNSVVQKLAVG